MIHHVDRGLAVLDADVHVQAENQIGARHQLHVLDDVLVALVGMNLLRAPVAETDASPPDASRRPFSRASRTMSRRSFFTSALASLMLLQTDGAHLDDGLVHLRLYPLLQDHLALFQNFGVNMRPQIAGHGIDCLIFLFNSDGKSRRHRSTNAGDSSGYVSSSLASKWEVRAGNPPPAWQDSITMSSKAIWSRFDSVPLPFSFTRAFTIFFTSASGKACRRGTESFLLDVR